jgi:ERF superfamily
MTPDTPQKSLVAKLAEACNAVGGVEKKGRNEFQNYNYVKAADVAKAIRHELFRRGVILVIDEKEFTQTRIIKTNSGGEMPEWLLKCEVRFCSENEVLGPFGAFGVAADKSDKAVYKCKTGALKYVLRMIGLIPDERDDPEFDESVDEQTDPRVIDVVNSPRGHRGTRRRRIAEYQARAWDAACRDSGKTAEQIAKYLRVRWSAASVSELTPEDFTEAIKWAMGTEDLAKTLATSTRAVKYEAITDEVGGI